MKKRLLAHTIAVGALLLIAATARAGDEDCRYYAADQWAPEGTMGCTFDGPTDGIASTWLGPVAAAQWCLYPWKDFTPIQVQSHDTGISIIVTPEQFCHCWWMTHRRLVDLTPGQVAALGLDAALGLFPVTVTALREGASSMTLPDTAVRP